MLFIKIVKARSFTKVVVVGWDIAHMHNLQVSEVMDQTVASKISYWRTRYSSAIIIVSLYHAKTSRQNVLNIINKCLSYKMILIKISNTPPKVLFWHAECDQRCSSQVEDPEHELLIHTNYEVLYLRITTRTI